jgi:2-polyprenyl-3-methyl-5-hydroxy-6-metoxy-1,4-benzoquinol methylase
LYRCASCGVVFLHPRPEETILSSLYSESYYGKGRKKFAAVLESAIAALTLLKWKRLRVLLGPGDRMLDVGCGRGTLVRLARAAGFEAYGLERHYPDAPFSPHIFYHDLTESAFPAGHFQAVVLWHVLEHLPEPVASLKEIHRLLRPGGWLSVAVPNFGGAQARASKGNWFHLDLPRHFWHFDAEALENLLESAGFQIVSRATLSVEYDWFGTLQSWMNRIANDDGRFYSLLKGELKAPASERVRRLALAGALVAPALVGALWDAALGQGGTLTLLVRKPTPPARS